MPVSPGRALRRHAAGSSDLPWTSRALRAQMRPAAACRAPFFAGAASAISYCVGECVGECVGDVHVLPREKRVAQPLPEVVPACARRTVIMSRSVPDERPLLLSPGLLPLLLTHLLTFLSPWCPQVL